MSNTLPTILAVDDDNISLDVIEGYLKSFNFAVVTASSGFQALELLKQREFDLIVSDLRMPDIDGIELLEEMRRRDINAPFIIVTACGSIESAVEAMRLGACDYLEKPYTPIDLQLKVQRAIDFHHVLTENLQLKQYLQEKFTFQNIITVSPAMIKTLEIASLAANSPHSTVAIYGESGTGKEVLARAIHFSSKGLPGNFVAVNCAAIPEALLESELFGHVRGAFTGAEKDREGKFATASGGTLLLDEIGDMPLVLQAKLLRVLEGRTYERVGSNTTLQADFRVIVATHRNLSEMVLHGAFREDLFHRINVIPLNIPPLRERVVDIPILTDHFLKQYRLHLGKTLPGISRNAINLLTSYHWPGNIRELRNVIEYAAIMVSDELIRPEHLRIQSAKESVPATTADGFECHICLTEKETSLRAITDQVLQIALQRCNGNKSHAAALLKIDRKRYSR